MEVTKKINTEYIEITDPDSEAVSQFHDNVLVEAFPDYHEREDVDIIRKNLREGSWVEGNEICKYHLIVAQRGSNIVGGVAFYFFSFGDYAIGMGSYLAVKKEFRRKGVGMRLINARDRTLSRDAQLFNVYLKGLVIQVNDPSLMSMEEIKRDPIDPWKREMFWKRRGYRKIAFNFIQPSIREGDPPVEYLSLHIFPYSPEWDRMEQISREELSNIIYCFIRCTGTVGPMESDPSYIRMKSELASQEYFSIL